MKELLQDLYDSELNAAIWWNWDGGVEVRFDGGLYGAEKNWREQNTVKDMDEAEAWLKETALRLYPHSTFAKKWVETTNA